MQHMTEVNGKEVDVLERFGKKAHVRLLETSEKMIVDASHLRLGGADAVAASLHSRARVSACIFANAHMQNTCLVDAR